MATTDANPTSSVPLTGDVAPTWPNSIAELRAEVIAGFLSSHERENADSQRLLDTTSFVFAAIELLAERGLIDADALEGRKQAVMDQLVHAFFEQGMGVTLMETEQDKYAFPKTADVDCAARIPVCRAICCKMYFALSQQDVEEGVIRWELGDPYVARKEKDGLCHHLDRETRFCTARDHRPIPCRSYTCQNDKRIWQDFDNMVLAPDVEATFSGPKVGRKVVVSRRQRTRDAARMVELIQADPAQGTEPA